MSPDTYFISSASQLLHRGRLLLWFRSLWSLFAI